MNNLPTYFDTVWNSGHTDYYSAPVLCIETDADLPARHMRVIWVGNYRYEWSYLGVKMFPPYFDPITWELTQIIMLELLGSFAADVENESL